MPKGKKGFQKGHKFFSGGEKNWFKKGEPSKGIAFKKGNKPYNTGLTSKKQPFYGKKHTEETKRKMRLASLGKKNPAWKGDFASYAAFHAWVKQHKGKAKKCSDCGIIKGKIEWSNVNHAYKRRLEDYKERCVKCHRKYDKKKNQ